MRYFTSDWHLNENRIFDFNPFFRPFESIEEQNTVIINNINKYVQPDDILYHLGDVSVDLSGIKLLDQIKCENKILIIGNYDIDFIQQLKPYFNEIYDELETEINNRKLYLTHYPTKQKPDVYTICGHIHSLWKVQPSMLNVSCDAWHFRPVSEIQLNFIINAMENYYDKNVFPDRISH